MMQNIGDSPTCASCGEKLAKQRMRTYKIRDFQAGFHLYHLAELFVNAECIGEMNFINVSERDAFIKEWSAI